MTEGEDYEVEFFNASSCGIGKAVFTSLDLKVGEDVSTVVYFPIVPPAPEFLSIGIEDGKIVGEITDMSGYFDGTIYYHIAYCVEDSYDFEFCNPEGPSFSFEIEEDTAYTVFVQVGFDVTGFEMDEELFEELYDEEEEDCYIWTDWSNAYVTPEEAEESTYRRRFGYALRA